MKKLLIIIETVLVSALVTTNFACAMELSEEGKAARRSIYIKNESEYPVRLSVSQEYPSSIALFPGQIMEFPAEKVQDVTVSGYGEKALYVTCVVANLNVKKLLNESPEFNAKDCLVTISYEKQSKESMSWFPSFYFFTQGKWTMSYRSIGSCMDIAEYKRAPQYSQKLTTAIAESSQSVPDAVVRDAALVWSMFPQAACKIEAKKEVYPFNVLSLDICGIVATDQQLRNWGELVLNSLRKKYACVTDAVLWSAVNMMIKDSVETLCHGNYYKDKYPLSPLSLLYFPTATSPDMLAEPAHPVEYIDRIKGNVDRDDKIAELIKQMQGIISARGWTMLLGDVSQQILRSPVLGKRMSPRESRVLRFEDDLQRKKPEERVLFDAVVQELFWKINALNFDPDEATKIRSAALEKLRSVGSCEDSISSLTQVRECMSPTILSLIKEDKDPAKAMQEWIDLLARADKTKAIEYRCMPEQKLQSIFHEQEKLQEREKSLLTHLKEQIKKFEDS